MAQQPGIGVGLIGCGTVGGGVAELLSTQAELYARRLGARLELRRVLVRDVAKLKKRKLVDAAKITSDADAFFTTPDMPIVIEVAGGKGVISQHVRRALDAGKHVITANKSLLAAEGPELFALARRRGASIAFEASCGGGIPIITATQFGLMANRIDAIYGILNGTCNYILTEMVQKSKPYAVALKEAQEKGFAEADPTLDVSGRDAAQKLAVLASLAFGVHVSDEQVWSEGIDKLDTLDIKFAGEMGYTVKLLAIAEREAGKSPESRVQSPESRVKQSASRNSSKSARSSSSNSSTLDSGLWTLDRLSLRVHPCFVHRDEPLAQVHGSFNAVSMFGHANGHTLYFGRGAGALPTASAIVSDLINVASGWYPKAFASLNLWSDGAARARPLHRDELTSRYYLRINALDVPGVMGKVTTALGKMGISISAVLQHESSVGNEVPVSITTHLAREGAIRKALTQIEKLHVLRGKPACIRVVDFPKG